MSTKIHTLNLLQGSIVSLYQVCKDVKWYKETIDLMNACAICKLIEARLPQVKKLNDIKPEDVDAWLEKPIKLKLSEALRETAKKTVKGHSEQGAFVPTRGIEILLSELGLEQIPDITSLLADDEDSEEADAHVPAKAASASA